MTTDGSVIQHSAFDIQHSGSGLCRCAVALLVSLLAACTAQRPPDVPKPVAPIRLLAVLDIEPALPGVSTTEATAPPRLPADAGRALTGQIYGVLADRSDFRFVPDLSISDAVRDASVRNAPTVLDRARALAKTVTADGIIFGTVSRFDERVGTELGATRPASVAFDLALLETQTGAVVWRGQFAKTQEALTSNLLQFWIFWESGARWITARELTRIGVEQLFDEMRDAARP